LHTRELPAFRKRLEQLGIFSQPRLNEPAHSLPTACRVVLNFEFLDKPCEIKNGTKLGSLLEELSLVC
jgi:hypothetical protein